MANKTSQTSASPSTCELCGKRLPQSTRPVRMACDICRTSPSSTMSRRPGSQPSSSGNSIPSTYLDLLDSKIAEYENAAERSSSNSRSINTDGGTDKATRTTQSSNLNPYIQDTRRGSFRKASPPGSVVMNRFLNDTTEADGVRDAILASRLIKSR